jgi:uncharacterized damage-inducible protein DinB
MAIRDALLPEFDHEMAGARTVLASIPADSLQFRPHRKSWNMAELGTHVGRLLSWAAPTLAMDEMDISGFVPEPALESVDAILELFDRNAAEARAALAAASDEDFLRSWTLRAGDTVYFSMPKAAVIRSFVMNHLVHHRGQLTVYLRMAGGKVPGLYGPSADDQEMEQQTQA